MSQGHTKRSRQSRLWLQEFGDGGHYRHGCHQGRGYGPAHLPCADRGGTCCRGCRRGRCYRCMAVKAAGAFQQGLNRLVTGAGDVTDNMKLMGQAILATSVDTGVLTDQLLPAMYQIISAGQRGAQAEDTLAVAARGSVVEQAKIVDVAKALTTAMTDYGTKQFNATQFMNGYTRAVQLGKITLEELSKSMGPLLPIARNLGINIQDVAAAMSTMTNANIP